MGAGPHGGPHSAIRDGVLHGDGAGAGSAREESSPVMRTDKAGDLTFLGVGTGTEGGVPLLIWTHHLPVRSTQASF